MKFKLNGAFFVKPFYGIVQIQLHSLFAICTFTLGSGTQEFLFKVCLSDIISISRKLIRLLYTYNKAIYKGLNVIHLTIKLHEQNLSYERALGEYGIQKSKIAQIYQHCILHCGNAAASGYCILRIQQLGNISANGYCT